MKPYSVFISATLGMWFATMWAVYKQETIWENGQRMLVSVILICFLIYYGYNMARE